VNGASRNAGARLLHLTGEIERGFRRDRARLNHDLARVKDGQNLVEDVLDGGRIGHHDEQHFGIFAASDALGVNPGSDFGVRFQPSTSCPSFRRFSVQMLPMMPNPKTAILIICFLLWVDQFWKLPQARVEGNGMPRESGNGAKPFGHSRPTMGKKLEGAMPVV